MQNATAADGPMLMEAAALGPRDRMSRGTDGWDMTEARSMTESPARRDDAAPAPNPLEPLMSMKSLVMVRPPSLSEALLTRRTLRSRQMQ